MITETARRPLFIATIFLGSFLLFVVQPLFARIALPSLGGAPGVWSVALVFYQAALLAGYLYAHLLVRYGGRHQKWIHFALFAAAALTLPIGLTDSGWSQSVGPSVWLFSVLAASIGAVFFVTSAQAPLLQAWYAAKGNGDEKGGDPYFLYAASNAGSFAALALYPVVIEPYASVELQRMAWSAAFIALAVLTLFAGRGAARTSALVETAGAIPMRRYAYWLALAAVPSGLMLSTTNFLTMDIVSVPLLWVIPLGLYLLSFIVAFSSGGAIFVRQARFLAPPLLLAIGSYSFLAGGILALLLALAGVILLFYLALALHGELAATRPDPAKLTSYYIAISLGGVLGGLFAGFLAPLIFDWTYEHPILLVAAAALIPATPLSKALADFWQKPQGDQVPWTIALLALAASVSTFTLSGDALLALRIAIGIAALVVIGCRLPFAVTFAALLLTMGGWERLAESVTTDTRIRSFFGVYTISYDEETGARRLEHGTTLHGLQLQAEDEAARPVGYYSAGSGAGQYLATLPGGSDVGIVGLGVGSLSCYRRPDQRWTFFEIDPAIVRIAQDETRFTYLSRCAPGARIVVGDARISLAERVDDRYDALVVDAFSSDAIPQHLMTVEAFHLYTRRLKDDGVLLVHISNRFLDLEPIVAAIAEELRWDARILDHSPGDEDGILTRSIWVAMAADEARLDLSEDLSWRPLERRGVQPWRDDFGSIMSVIRY